MRLVGGADALNEVASMLAFSNWARIAVAYWGEGAVRRLGLDKLPRTSDLCIALDLMSGACNPGEVRSLIKHLGRSRVMAVDELHAKLWLTKAGALIGSSNASANGFGHEGQEDEVTGLIEANLVLPPLLDAERQAWTDWFEDQVWAHAYEITDPILAEAERRWKARRARRGATKPATSAGKGVGMLLDRLREDPGFFRDKQLRIVAYRHTKLTPPARRGLKAEQKARALDDIDCYERWRLAPGEYVLDLDWDAQSGSLLLEGLWKAAEVRTVVRLQGTSITLVHPMRDFEGFRVGTARAWKKAAAEVIASLQKRRKLRGKSLDISAEEFGAELSRQ
ncbi:phospholipase D family protein [Falsiroseomonas sp. HC035]|uniref:phospholipase D family protein n=1 Tax=Falsiroseomonas sp. HC035 TaxID=3390999 RepID=UPI003D3243D0